MCSLHENNFRLRVCPFLRLVYSHCRKVTFSCEGNARQGVTKVYWPLYRNMRMTKITNLAVSLQVHVQGADSEGHPFSFIKEV